MRPLLIVRGIVGLFFGFRFLSDTTGSWSHAFSLLAEYLIVDGVLGFIIAGLLRRQPLVGGKPRLRILATVLIVDAVGRIATGIAVKVWPAIAEFPVTALIFIALVAVMTAAVGFAEAALIAEEDIARYGHQHARPQFPISPVLLSSVASLAFGGAALFFAGNTGATRIILAGYVTAAAMVMFAMAWTRRNYGGDVASR
jgi:hypothetical protein